MSRKNKSPRVARRLGVESLENRRLMASDVTAQLVSGNLVINEGYIKGQANDVSISRLANGDIRVSGNAKTGSLINGQAFVDFRAKAVQNLSVNLGDGSDALRIDNVAFKNVDIAMGKIGSIMGDNDKVTINALTTRGSLNITTADGADDIKITQSHIGNGLLDSGETQLDQLMILSGKGADIVTIGDTTHLMDVKGVMHINTTSVTALATDGTPNQTELGDDRVSITSVDVTNEINVWLGGGTNTLDMTGVTTSNYLSVYGGTGQDTARMRDVMARNGLFARMGAGNDRLELNNVDTLGSMNLNGGDGVDTLIRSLDSTAASLFVSNWE